MLVIRRRKDQVIHVGPEILVKVIEVRGKTVAIGIQAPPEFPVRRGEKEERGEEGQR